MRRIGAMALVLWAGLAFVVGAQAKPKHQPLKCKAGYARRGVWIPKRVHGRIVRRHGRIVRIKVQRCVRTPKPKPASPVPPPAGTPTTPTTSQPPVTPTGPSPTTTTISSPTPPPPPPPVTGDPVVVAVGDIARPPGCAPNCEQSATAALAQAFNPAAVLVLGDNQYEEPEEGVDSDNDYMGSYDLTWGRDFNSIVHPVPGNHEYLGSDAAGYFTYFGDHGVTTNPPGGYYSFNLGNWHIIALNSNCSDQNGCSDAIDGRHDVSPADVAAAPIWQRTGGQPHACVLAMWHHPLFSCWTLGPWGGPKVAQLYTALYNAHADVVLNGHDHLYERYAQQDPSGNEIHERHPRVCGGNRRRGPKRARTRDSPPCDAASPSTAITACWCSRFTPAAIPGSSSRRAA